MILKSTIHSHTITKTKDEYWTNACMRSIDICVCYLTALLTNSAIFFSSAAVSLFNAYEFGHMLPSSRFALSLKPRTEYLALNLPAFWKKHIPLSNLHKQGSVAKQTWHYEYCNHDVDKDYQRYNHV